MSLSRDRWARVEELLAQALGLPQDRRGEFLQEACGEDAALLEEIQSLLDAADRPGDFLLKPVTVGDPRPTPATLPSGAALGPWRIGQPIGHGGMGEVYIAERADNRYQSRVAIKLLHTHLVNPATQQRFTREGQLLARLSHPNIARLLDAGATAEGRPYLVLEYIDGERLDRWCDLHALELSERIQLLLQACDAVAHAHTHLIVHRDLKPTNILVNREATVKLLDFGIAKLVENDGDTTELTRLGGRLLTPRYAAPEQVDGGPITTATDVYALGVILYELLTGKSPYGSSVINAGQLERAVMQTGLVLPSKASISGEQARARGSTARELRRLLAGDLDNIVAKALSKAPVERYVSAQAMADDLRRHLNNEPISASAPSLSYRAGKFVRRHKLSVAISATLIVTIVIGIAATLWQASRAQRENVRAHAEAVRAQKESARAEVTKDFLLRVFRTGNPQASRNPRAANERLDLNARRIIEEFSGDPDTQIELLGVAASVYAELGDEDQYQSLRVQQMELVRAHGGEQHPAAIRGLLDDAARKCMLSVFSEALALLDRTDVLIRNAGLENSATRARWWFVRAWALSPEAEAAGASLAALKNSVNLYAKYAPADQGYLDALNQLAIWQIRVGDQPALAKQTLKQALRAADSVQHRDDTSVQLTYSLLASLMEQQGDFDGAERAFEQAANLIRRTHGETYPPYWTLLEYQARAAHAGGKSEHAQALFEHLLKIVPADHPSADWIRKARYTLSAGEER